MSKKPVHSAKLGGKRWSIKEMANFTECGFCGDCDHDKRVIRVDSDERGHNRLDTILHEALHAVYPFFCETAVSEPCKEISRLLWRLGYRREDEKDG